MTSLGYSKSFKKAASAEVYFRLFANAAYSHSRETLLASPSLRQYLLKSIYFDLFLNSLILLMVNFGLENWTFLEIFN